MTSDHTSPLCASLSLFQMRKQIRGIDVGVLRALKKPQSCSWTWESSVKLREGKELA